MKFMCLRWREEYGRWRENQNTCRHTWEEVVTQWACAGNKRGLLPPVTICLGCYNKKTVTWMAINNTYFSVLDAGKSKFMALKDCAWWRPASSWTAVFSLEPHMAEGASKLSGASCTRALTHSWGLQPHDLMTFYRLLLKTINLGFQHMNFRGTQTFKRQIFHSLAQWFSNSRRFQTCLGGFLKHRLLDLDKLNLYVLDWDQLEWCWWRWFKICTQNTGTRFSLRIDLECQPAGPAGFHGNVLILLNYVLVHFNDTYYWHSFMNRYWNNSVCAGRCFGCSTSSVFRFLDLFLQHCLQIQLIFVSCCLGCCCMGEHYITYPQRAKLW